MRTKSYPELASKKQQAINQNTLSKEKTTQEAQDLSQFSALNADALAKVTKGKWLIVPSKDWSATGLCIWAPSFKFGQMIVARSKTMKTGYLSKKVSKKVLIEAICKVVGNGYHITSNFANDISKNVSLSKPKNLYRALSPRESEVFKMLIEGKRNFEISSSLNLNPKTINTYKTRLMQKLDVKNQIDLFQQAKNFNLV